MAKSSGKTPRAKSADVETLDVPAELLELLDSLGPDAECSDGLTTQEWRAKLGIGMGKMRRLLRAGIEAGIIAHGQRPITYINGTKARVDVYRVIDR